MYIICLSHFLLAFFHPTWRLPPTVIYLVIYINLSIYLFHCLPPFLSPFRGRGRAGSDSREIRKGSVRGGMNEVRGDGGGYPRDENRPREGGELDAYDSPMLLTESSMPISASTKSISESFKSARAESLMLASEGAPGMSLAVSAAAATRTSRGGGAPGRRGAAPAHAEAAGPITGLNSGRQAAES